MAQQLMQTVSLSVSHLGLVTAAGPGLLSSVFFAEAGVGGAAGSPFFKPADSADEPREPVAIQACPWLHPQLSMGERLTRLALRAAHEALDAWLETRDPTEQGPTLWVVVPAERPGISAEALSALQEALWRDLRPRNVRVMLDETGAMQALAEIYTALAAGEAAALLLAVDSFFSAAFASEMATGPVAPWDPLGPTPSEAAAAVLFTGKGKPRTSLSASRAGTLGFSMGGGPASVDALGATSLASSRLASTALGAGSSGGIARVVAVGAASGIATEGNDELQDGLAMTALLEGLNSAIRPEVILGPAEVSVFRGREWEMAASRAPKKLAQGCSQIDVSRLFGWVGAASALVGLVYAIAATRLGLLSPQDGNWLTAGVWSVSPRGARGLLGVMTEAQPDREPQQLQGTQIQPARGSRYV